MITDRKNGDGHTSAEITLRRGKDSDIWIAEDVATGITSQGSSREEALSNLDEAVAGVEGAGDTPTDDELASLGIDPESNTSGEPTDADPFNF